MSRANVCVGLGLLLIATIVSAQEPSPTKGQPGRGDKKKEVAPPARVEKGEPRAEEGEPRAEKGEIAQPGRREQGAASTADSQLAACLIVDNEGEVAISQLAEQKSQNKEVQAFAQMMIKDHQKMIQDLERFAGANASQNKATIRVDASAADQPRTEGNQREENQRQPRTTVAVAPGRGEASLDFVALKRELGQQCLQSTQTEMEKKEGAEFDKCFAFQQVMKHMQAVDTIEVFKRHAGSDLQTVLTEGLQVAQTHLEHAKELAKKLDASPEESSAVNTKANRTEVNKKAGRTETNNKANQ